MDTLAKEHGRHLHSILLTTALLFSFLCFCLSVCLSLSLSLSLSLCLSLSRPFPLAFFSIPLTPPLSRPYLFPPTPPPLNCLLQYRDKQHLSKCMWTVPLRLLVHSEMYTCIIHVDTLDAGLVHLKTVHMKFEEKLYCGWIKISTKLSTVKSIIDLFALQQATCSNPLF